MDHICLAQWRKFDNETFVKSDNFNHINDRRSDTCEDIHSHICRHWDMCGLNPVSDLGQMLQTFAEPPGPCSGYHSCPGHLQRETPACQQAAKRDLDVQVSVHRLGSAGDWQHLRQLYPTNKKQLWKKCMPYVIDMSLKAIQLQRQGTVEDKWTHASFKRQLSGIDAAIVWHKDMLAWHLPTKPTCHILSSLTSVNCWRLLLIHPTIAIPLRIRCAHLAMWSIDKKHTSRMNKIWGQPTWTFCSKVCIEPQCHLTSPWHMHKHTSKEPEASLTISSFVMNSEGSRFILPSFRIHSAKIGEMEVESEQLQQSMGLLVYSRTVPNCTDTWQAWSIDLGSSNNSHLSNSDLTCVKWKWQYTWQVKLQ